MVAVRRAPSGAPAFALFPRSTNLRTAATPRISSEAWLPNQENMHMFKVTPNPPDTDPASPYESVDSKKFHEAAERALDHYLNPGIIKSPATRKPSTMFMLAPDIRDEDLLAHTCGHWPRPVSWPVILRGIWKGRIGIRPWRSSRSSCSRNWRRTGCWITLRCRSNTQAPRHRSSRASHAPTLN